MTRNTKRNNLFQLVQQVISLISISIPDSQRFSRRQMTSEIAADMCFFFKLSGGETPGLNWGVVLTHGSHFVFTAWVKLAGKVELPLSFWYLRQRNEWHSATNEVKQRTKLTKKNKLRRNEKQIKTIRKEWNEAWTKTLRRNYKRNDTKRQK